MVKEIKTGRTVGGFAFLAITLAVAVVAGLWMWWVMAFLLNTAGALYDFAANKGLDNVDSQNV